jgi:hypothetical protein
MHGKCYTIELERPLAIRIDGATILAHLGYPKDVVYPLMIPIINISLNVFI